MASYRARCLIVDDEPLCSYMACKLLEQLSCVADHAETSAIAYTMLQSKDYDIIFSMIHTSGEDCNMTPINDTY